MEKHNKGESFEQIDIPNSLNIETALGYFKHTIRLFFLNKKDLEAGCPQYQVGMSASKDGTSLEPLPSISTRDEIDSIRNALNTYEKSLGEKIGNILNRK